MNTCYCGCFLAILVIVFAWMPFAWAKIVLTILGALLAIKSFVGTCCCKAKKEESFCQMAPESTDEEKVI